MICHKSKQKRSEVDALMRYCSFNEKEALLKWTEGMRIFRNSAGIEQESFLENCSLLLPPLPISQVPVITAQKSIDSRTLQTPIKIPSGTSSSSKRKSKRKAYEHGRRPSDKLPPPDSRAFNVSASET
jgi:hypothetical protein